MTTYPSSILATMTNSLMETGFDGRLFDRIDFHATAYGSRAVVRDMKGGVDYEIVVSPIIKKATRKRPDNNDNSGLSACCCAEIKWTDICTDCGEHCDTIGGDEG